MSANKFPRRRSTALGAAECDPIDTEASTESALQERVASLEASLEKMQKLHGKDVEETVTPLEVEATVAESVESALVQEISVDANLAAVEVEEEPRTEEVAPDTVAGAMVQPTVADAVDESEADVEEEHEGDDDDGKKEEANEEEANENATADEESTTADEVVDEEVVDDDKGDDKGNHLIDNLMTRVAQLEKKSKLGHNTEVLNIASAAVAAADKIAGVAAQQRASVETVAADLSARLSAQVGDAFKTAVESSLVTHTDLIGTRLQAQFEDRLQVARETAAGLGMLRQEMTKISASLAAESVDMQEEKKADEKQLPRVGSIFQ